MKQKHNYQILDQVHLTGTQKTFLMCKPNKYVKEESWKKANKEHKEHGQWVCLLTCAACGPQPIPC